MTKSMDNSSNLRHSAGISAIVEQEYAAKEVGELSLNRGAIIQNAKRQPNGLWEGSLAGKTGLFRESFVRFLDSADGVVLRDPSTTVNRRCKVVYSYKQNNNDELNLGVGDIIEVLEEVEEGWWRGRLNNNTGVFPSNFVELLEASPQSANRQSKSGGDMVATNNANNLKASAVATANLLASEKDAPMLPPKPVRELCKVLYPYEPSNGDELELNDGDIITIISKELPDKGWWKGELHGKVGVFPDNFVTILPPDAVPIKSERPTSISKPVSTKVPTVIALVANNGSANSNHLNDNHNNNKSASIIKTRKDSFGSKDSLTDSGIVTGNVAAHRRSLESKAVPDAVVDKPPRKSFPASSNEKMSELRKSLECLDEKKAVPPPVLTKKPSVPAKKSPISGVTSNLLSGLKSKVTSSSSSSTSATTASKATVVKVEPKDNLDGGGLSRMQVADNAERHVHGERISMQSDFDQVERSTGVLKDMRANRAKLPKGRRPPSGAVNQSSTDLPNLLNGSSGSMDDSGITHASAASSQSEDELVKPKPREWEKNRAPWMAELKASQMKKSPDSRRDTLEDQQESTTHHSMFSSMSSANESTSANTTTSSSSISTGQHEKFDMSKSFSSSYVSSGLMSNSSSSHTTSTTVGGKKLESLEAARSQSVDVHKSESLRSKSMIMGGRGATTEDTSMTSTATITSTSSNSSLSAAASTARPTSVNLRNHSIAPVGNRSSISTKVSTIGGEASDMSSATTISTTTTTTNGIGSKQPQTDAQRITDLEQRVISLEGTVQNLVGLVKTLRGELDKYAQCVTQV